MIGSRCIVLVILLRLLALPAPAWAADPWVLVWADEFNGRSNSPPDFAKWKYDLGHDGWGNHELETYTNSTRNVFVDGRGHLAIRAIKTSTGAFTSGRLKTLGLFEVKYGKIEARIRIPYGQGIWPAFWMLGNDFGTKTPWPECGEIDVMENIGREPMLVHGTLHGPGYSGASGIGASALLPGNSRFADDFHIFGVEWSAVAIEFFLDGRSYARRTRASLPRGAAWVYDHPFFLLLNLAVGGDWPNNPDETTRFPQTMLVDWVRVWRLASEAH
jgi:beta-glucanase (GH16 family)